MYGEAESVENVLTPYEVMEAAEEVMKQHGERARLVVRLHYPTEGVRVRFPSYAWVWGDVISRDKRSTLVAFQAHRLLSAYYGLLIREDMCVIPVRRKKRASTRSEVQTADVGRSNGAGSGGSDFEEPSGES